MLRRAMIAICLCLFLSFNISLADAVIKPENRMDNRPPGFCVWITLEMIGKQHGIPKLIGLADYRNELPWIDIVVFTPFPRVIKEPQAGANLEDTRVELERLKVKYRWAKGPGPSMRLLRKYTSRDIGALAAVGHREDAECPLGNHAILITGFDDKYVFFVDCNEKKEDFRWELEEFVYFLKWSVAVEPGRDD